MVRRPATNDAPAVRTGILCRMTPERPRRTQQERTAATRAALIAAARLLFSEHGYAATVTEDVVRAANVTRGALYHHFKDKRDLFEAVFVEVELELDASVRDQAQAAGDAWRGFLAGCRAYFEIVVRPDVSRIVLHDGPSVLGWERWREIDQQYSIKSVQTALDGLMALGLIKRRPSGPLATLLVGALNEAGLYIAHAQDHAAAKAALAGAFEALVVGLRAPAAA